MKRNLRMKWKKGFETNAGEKLALKRMKRKKVSDFTVFWTKGRDGGMMSVRIRCFDCQNDFGGFEEFSRKEKLPPTLENVIFYLEFELSAMAMHICPKQKMKR